MKSFEASFQKGIRAAQAAVDSQREIQSVIREFSDSLESATRGRVKVLQREISPSLGAIFTQKLDNELRTKALVIASADDTLGKDLPSVEVAKWRSNEAGYPCWLIVGGQEIACVDRRALEDELSMLASSPRMGDAILRVIDKAK